MAKVTFFGKAINRAGLKGRQSRQSAKPEGVSELQEHRPIELK